MSREECEKIMRHVLCRNVIVRTAWAAAGAAAAVYGSVLLQAVTHSYFMHGCCWHRTCRSAVSNIIRCRSRRTHNQVTAPCVVLFTQPIYSVSVLTISLMRVMRFLAASLVATLCGGGNLNIEIPIALSVPLRCDYRAS